MNYTNKNNESLLHIPHEKLFILKYSFLTYLYNPQITAFFFIAR